MISHLPVSSLSLVSHIQLTMMIAIRTVGPESCLGEALVLLEDISDISFLLAPK